MPKFESGAQVEADESLITEDGALPIVLRGVVEKTEDANAVYRKAPIYGWKTSKDRRKATKFEKDTSAYLVKITSRLLIKPDGEQEELGGEKRCRRFHESQLRACPA